MVCKAVYWQLTEVVSAYSPVGGDNIAIMADDFLVKANLMPRVPSQVAMEFSERRVVLREDY